MSGEKTNIGDKSTTKYRRTKKEKERKTTKQTNNVQQITLEMQVEK